MSRPVKDQSENNEGLTNGIVILDKKTTVRIFWCRLRKSCQNKLRKRVARRIQVWKSIISIFIHSFR